MDYKKEWTLARKDAECLHRTMHDFRRTAARNLTGAGLPENQAMKFTGHKTNSVFRRYAIADAVSMQEAGEKYAAHLNGAKTRAKTEGTKAVSQ